MKELFPHSGQLAAELLGVLLAYPGEFFAPGELVGTLRNCPSWQVYLGGFETERGQPAAVGRYLNELGLSKNGHHRTRGSLYSSQSALTRLQQALDDARQARSAQAAVGDNEVMLLRSETEEEEQPRPEPETTPQRRRSDETTIRRLEGVPAAASVPAAMATAAGTVPSGASGAVGGTMSGSLGGGGVRSGPVIGWRRRASDLARSPHRSANAATAEMPGAMPSTLPPLSLPAYNVAAGLGGAAAPVWVGGGGTATIAAPAYAPGMMMPYPGLQEMNGAGMGADDAGLPLSFYWTQIRRHLYKIVLATVLVTTLVGFYTLRIPKLYEAVATLRMDFKGSALLASNSDSSGPSAFDPTTLIQTEVTDVGQRAVVLDAITSAHLDQDVNLLKQLRNTSRTAPTVANPTALEDALVGLVQSGTTAIPPDGTHNIDIHFKSLDPATSATVANALATALMNHEFITRQQEQDQTLAFMTKQYNDITANMEGEQAALTAYQHQNNILNPDSTTNLESATLTTLNNNYLAAQEELNKYLAEQSVLKTGQLTDALLASSDGSALRPTYDAWRAAQLNFEQIAKTRGAANPEYKKAHDTLDLAKQQLDAAVASVNAQIDSQYDAARKHFELVAKDLATAKSAVQSFNDKAIDFGNLKRSLDTDTKLHDDLQAQIKQQQIAGSQSSSSLRVTNPATPNATPVYPSLRKNVTLAFLFSLFFGCGLAVLAGYMDRSFTSPDGVEQYLRIPLLGALPVIANKSNPIELAEAISESESTRTGKPTTRSAFAEAVLMLRTAVMYSAPHGFRTLCVTSAQPQEGKSIITANLAIAMALHGAKVLLIDGDIRRPTQHRIFEVGNQTGLSSVLRQTAPIEECFRATTVEKLFLMPAGPAVPNPSELVATMMSQVLAPLGAEFDYILVDSPPVLGFADAVSISTVVEGTVLVARAGKTPRELVHASLQPLKRVRARVLGLILNQVSSSLNPYYSYYRDHYARYYGGRDEDETPNAGGQPVEE